MHSLTSNITRVEVDGKVLVDHNNIGVDASGNGNHFHDQNFAVGNTSQVWSQTGADPNSVISYGVVADVFNGSFSGTTGTMSIDRSDVDNIKYVTLTEASIDCETQLGIYAQSGADASPYVRINSGDDIIIPAPLAEAGWAYVPFTGTINKIEVAYAGVLGSSTGFCAVSIDGVQLIDANIQDTVVDTPVKNYAVLYTNGANGVVTSNGNLKVVGNHATASVVSTVATSSNFYFEMTAGQADALIGYSAAPGDPNKMPDYCLVGGSGIYIDGSNTQSYDFTFTQGDVIGFAANLTNQTAVFYKNGVAGSTLNVTYSSEVVGAARDYGNGGSEVNFGQQPFAYGAHDLNAGTVVIDYVTYGTLYQTFEDYQVAGGYFYDEKNQKPVRGSDLRKRFGRDTANEQLGIYNLTEVPSHQVIGYEKTGELYAPLRDYTPEVRTAQAETAVAQAETVAAQAQADQYLSYLRAAACAWIVGRVYEAGEIVEFNGQLYKALVNQAATADTDPGDETDQWESIGIAATAD